MKTKAALALSLTGFLLTGTAALGANAQTLSNASRGGTDDAGTILLTDDSASAPAVPAPSTAGAVTLGDDRKASPSPEPSTAPSAEFGDDNGGQRALPEPGDDKSAPGAGQTTAGNAVSITVEPGDDKGGVRMVPEAGDDKAAPVTAPTSTTNAGPVTAEPGDDKGGVRTAPEAGDDKGGLREAPQPGGDSGGHGGSGKDD